MTSTNTDSKPGRITYTGRINISRPRTEQGGDYLRFKVLKNDNEPSAADDIQYDKDGIPHNLRTDMENKTFLMSDHDPDEFFLGTNDESFQETYGKFLDCDQKLCTKIRDFRAVKDGTMEKEVEGTITGQLRHPGKPPLSCLVPRGFIYCPTAKLTSVKERGRQGGRFKYERGLDREFTLEDFEFPNMVESTGYTPVEAESVENLFKNSLSGRNLLVQQNDWYRTEDYGRTGYTNAYFPILDADTSSGNINGFNFILHGESRYHLEEKNTHDDNRHKFSLGWKLHDPSAAVPSEMPDRDESIKSSVAVEL